MELVISVALLGIIMVALTGVVLSYLKTTVNVQARLTESHDVQFASAYWQRDVASVGRRSTTYDDSAAVHTYSLLQSVAKAPNTGVSAACTVPSGPSVTVLVTLAWTEYVASDPEHPATVTVTYLAEGAGSQYSLVRVRCTGSTKTSTLTLADNLKALPIVSCDGAAGTNCNLDKDNVPLVVTMKLVADDPENNDGSTYTATLTGERRQT